MKPGKWRLYTVLSWLGGEIAGAILGMAIFGDDLISIVLVALAGAFAGYFIIKANLNKRPDNLEDDIDKIGVDDLRP